MGFRLEEQSVDVAKQKKRRSSRRRRVARKTVEVVPTLFTLGNLLCGFIAIFLASRSADVQLPFGWSPLTFAASFIFLGMVMDGLDGRIARLTRSFSELGAQLDSMADMVTFGVAPAFLAVQLMDVGMPFASQVDQGDAFFDRLAIVIAGIYVMCAGLRLARFNMELGSEGGDDHNSFKGLPSPGAAGTVASLILLHQHFLRHYEPTHWLVSMAAIAMVATMLLVALGMVSSIRYVHVMNRYVRGHAPINTLAKALVVACLLVIYPQPVMAAGFVLYAVWSPMVAGVNWLRLRGKRQAA